MALENMAAIALHAGHVKNSFFVELGKTCLSTAYLPLLVDFSLTQLT